MPVSSASKPQDISLGEFKAKLYEFFGGPSHSDVGNKSINLKTKIIMPIMAGVMNLSNPNLNLQGSNFLPTHNSENYETVTLKGYIAIIELEKNVKFVLYGNSAAIQNPDKDYYPMLKEEILTAFKAIKINKLSKKI